MAPPGAATDGGAAAATGSWRSTPDMEEASVDGAYAELPDSALATAAGAVPRAGRRKAVAVAAVAAVAFLGAATFGSLTFGRQKSDIPAPREPNAEAAAADQPSLRRPPQMPQQLPQTTKLKESEQVELPAPRDAETEASWSLPSWLRPAELSSDNEERPCQIDTGGTCRLSKCFTSRGPTQCVSGKCICQIGYYAHKGACVASSKKTCPQDTGGTCTFFGCSSYRKAKCISGKCLCEDTDHCVNNGQCRPAGECSSDTGGTCSLLPCNSARGPTSCINGRCHCSAGYCARNGKCDQLAKAVYGETVAVVEGMPFPGLHGKVQTALCFSGGGSRSLSNSLGAFRALENLGLMKHVDAISSVSGGTWASALYMFANVSLEELLGAPTDPRSLDMEVLSHTPARMGSVATQSMAGTVAEMMTARISRTQMWEFFVTNTFLTPFNLGTKDAFMAASPEAVERIKQTNPALANRDFHVPMPGRPGVFVMSGAILSPLGTAADASSVYSLQMSPDWTGSPYRPFGGMVQYDLLGGGRTDPRFIGGGFVESFAFGGPAPHRETPGEQCFLTNTNPFSLSDAIGISSCALASALAQHRGMQSLVPVEQIWPVLTGADQERQPSETYKMGDGGNIENAGLLVMLQRRATKIIWFVNTDTGLNTANIDFCAGPPEDKFDPNAQLKDGKPACTNQLTDKFGWGINSATAGYLSNNQVFLKEDFWKVTCELQKLKLSGKPALFRTTLPVLRNSFWRIEGGFEVDITFVYNEECDDFVNLLPRDTQDAVKHKRDDFVHYPFYATTFEHDLELVQLSNAQVNLLAAQTEYFLMENAELLKDQLRRA
eukprot:TRINITY_DN21993_c0_g2_i2.p1 TRINITY_DN21993_c0_g2~~TRINITY_DN21993_c0_g2_i2.p1  ORF type:complete len:850 (+),score=151.40 TRINITY_DN21993_c0_g2_i2:54-2552(+)